MGDEIARWLERATPSQVAERLRRAEYEALAWHVVSTPMPEADRTAILKMVDDLIAGGYQNPSIEQQDGHEEQPRLF